MRNTDRSRILIIPLRGILLAAAFLLTLSGLLQAAVSVEYDRKAEFSRYTTYAWGEGTSARRRAIQDSIVTAVDRELQARSLKKVKEGAALRVFSHALIDEHSLEQLSDPTYWKFWTGFGDVDARALKVGTLVVDLQDIDSEKLVWRGLASGAVDEKVKKIAKRINRLVAKMFKDFPP